MHSKELLLTYFPNDEVKSMSLMDSKITDFINKSSSKTSAISTNVLKQNMINTINGIAQIFEDEQLENRNFYVDEINVALNIGIEGSVSILSVVSGQANMQSSIVVKLKRSEKIER